MSAYFELFFCSSCSSVRMFLSSCSVEIAMGVYTSKKGSKQAAFFLNNCGNNQTPFLYSYHPFLHFIFPTTFSTCYFFPFYSMTSVIVFHPYEQLFFRKDRKAFPIVYKAVSRMIRKICLFLFIKRVFPASALHNCSHPSF